jgi:dipeptidyl aminopeptidase/acylaminoacyl peptidase
MPFLPRSIIRSAALLTALAGAAAAQSKPFVTQKDLAKWEQLGPSRLSPDGAWLTWSITRGDQDVNIQLRGGAHDSTIVIPFGTAAAFSGDSKWFAYLVGVSTKERERLAKEKKPVHSSFAARNLATGEVTTIPDVSAFSFAPSGPFVSVTRATAEGKKVSDVLVLDLAKGTRVSLANIAEQAWSEAKPLLALTTIVDGGNSILVFDANTGATHVLESSPSIYRTISWRPKSDGLAILRTRVTKDFADTAHVILQWASASVLDAKPRVLDPFAAPSSGGGLPASLRIAEYRRPAWSADGHTLFFGVQRRFPVADAIKKSDEPVSDVEIWHVNDVQTIPAQRSSETRDLHATVLAAWHADGSVVTLGQNPLNPESILEGDRFTTETDEGPYAWGAKFGRRDMDYWVTDVASGVRRKLLEKVRHLFTPDPTGSRVPYFDGKDYWIADVASGARTNLTASLRASQKVDFVDRDDDHPTDILPAIGQPVWSKDGSKLLVNSEYDIWELALDGSGGRRLTNGAKDGVTSRVVALRGGFNASAVDRAVDLSKPVWLALYGKRTKQSGYAQLMPNGDVKRLIMEDASVGNLAKADSADRYSYVKQTFAESPNVFVAGATLDGAKRFTDTNPFQKDYAWGHAELINFKSTIGRPLQGILYYPANWDATKKYPMIVYTYELLSQGLHRYIVPRENDYYNANVFTQNGYFVLMPDIVFRPRQPGVDVQASVEPAIASVIARGLVDPANIGHCGHSQGGYEAYFLATHSKMIKTAVAGAGITDMNSFAGQMHWTSVPEFDHWETGQFRMEVPPWEDRAAMSRNNPLEHVQDMPAKSMLMEIGGEDPTVDMRQGVEFWNYARRAGKQAVLLLYPGEGHGLGKRQNAIDYERRILQWFGHYLKGDPAPKWITEGQSWIERKQILDANKP